VSAGFDSSDEVRHLFTAFCWLHVALFHV